MPVYLRYIGAVLAVLVLAVVFVACGDIACGETMHPCCEKSDRADRGRADTGKTIAVCALRGDAASSLAKWFPRTHSRIALASLTLAPSLALSVSPLRI